MQYNSIHTGEDIDAGISKTQGVASNATANATDAQLRDRETHTGTQPLSSISGAAALASPTFTGTPAAPTAAAETNTTQIATTAYTRTAIRYVMHAYGAAPLYACRAWVNFNGTGTVAIRASGNVSSITDNGVGDYTVNFATDMGDASYAANISYGFNGYPNNTENDTGSFQRVNGAAFFRFMIIESISDQGLDADVVMVSIFR